MRNIIFAIDPSLNSTGICILRVGSKTPTAYYNIRPELNDPKRLQYIYHTYVSLFKSYEPELQYIAYERQVPQMRYQHSARNITDLSENIGILKLAILETVPTDQVKILRATPEEIKKYATGNSKADKDAMMNAVNGNHMKRIRSTIIDPGINDVSDAYHLANYVNHRIESGDLASLIYEGWD